MLDAIEKKIYINVKGFKLKGQLIIRFGKVNESW